MYVERLINILSFYFVIAESPPSVPDWPLGTFGLPRAKLGCPHSDKITWSKGWRYQDTEDQNASNQKSRSFHMDAVVGKSAVNRSFCIATMNNGTREWPKGEVLMDVYTFKIG